MRPEAYERKRSFTIHELARCVAAACREPVRLEYRLEDSGGEPAETVTIRRADGCLHRVDVTGADLMETMRAVLNIMTYPGEVE